MAKRRRKTPQNVDPSAMKITDAAKMFSQLLGETVTAAMIKEDIGEGAPANSDGTINLLHYGAWLVKERSLGG